MTDERPPGIGWLHYRLAVAACSAFVTAIMLFLVPLVFAMRGPTRELFPLYKFVFSKWGVATLIGSAVIGFVVGGERMANFFAFIWGTHPIWSDIETWLWEHEVAATFIGFALVALVVGFFWYSFR